MSSSGDDKRLLSRAVDVLAKQIAEVRAKRKAEGKRTTEATQQLFDLGPAYDWQADPKHYRDESEDHSIPLYRCTHWGFRYVGWKQAAPFCNICHLAHVGNMVIEPEQRVWIQSHVRIPEGMSEMDFIIREKKRAADEEYKRRTGVNRQSIESDFKRSVDLV